MMLPSNDQESNIIECRICHSKTTRDLILSPCLCKGSMGCVHIGCLEHWLNISSHTFCELCSYKFEVIQVRRYTFFQSIPVWFMQNHNSLHKTLFFVILSTINSVLLCWMWILWITNVPSSFVKERETESNDTHIKEDDQDIGQTKWIVVFMFLTLLTVFAIKGLCCDVCHVVKIQCQAWYQWWNSTVNVQLVLDLQNYKICNKLDETKNHDFKFNQEKVSSKKEEANYHDFKDTQGEINNKIGEASVHHLKCIEENTSDTKEHASKDHDIIEMCQEKSDTCVDEEFVCDEEITVADNHSRNAPNVTPSTNQSDGNC
uniref:RING-CH-type domain-containing protein n=1 Tax=Graphocephala atropunctata TaxID=36148 RepID=A0A1B6MFQ1_9HEMI